MRHLQDVKLVEIIKDIYQLRYKDTIRDRSERSTDLNFSLYVYTNNHAMRVIGPKLVLYFKNL